ncbi:ankyrin repeat protein [Ostertagia ostertagi]
MPPYLTAACHNALEVVKILIERGTDIFVTDEEGRTAIHVGAKFNAIKVLRVLYEYGAALDALDEDEDTPLLLAAMRGETISG